MKEIGPGLQPLLNSPHSIMNIEHNWEDLCIQLRNQQNNTFDNHKYIMGSIIFNMTFTISHQTRFISSIEDGGKIK